MHCGGSLRTGNCRDSPIGALAGSIVPVRLQQEILIRLPSRLKRQPERRREWGDASAKLLERNGDRTTQCERNLARLPERWFRTGSAQCDYVGRNDTWVQMDAGMTTAFRL